MESNIKGIVLRTVNYKEADKIASLFTLEEGLIAVKFTGVRRDKAKMKAVSQPFSLCEFTINKTKEHRTVISASAIDLFNTLTSDYSRMMCGYIVLDIIKSILPEDKPEPEIFLLSINALKNIEQNNPYIATIDYIIKFLDINGLGLVFPDANYVYLNKDTGDIVVNREEFCYELDKRVYHTLQSISRGVTVEDNDKTFIQILRLLNNVIYAKFNVEIKSFQFI